MKNLAGILCAILCCVAWPSFASAQFRLDTPNGYLKISGRLRAAYNYRFYRKDNKNHQENRFYLPEARLRFRGEIYEQFDYDFHFEFSTSRGTLEAKDLKLGYRTTPFLALSAGQFKVPYSRQRIVSSSLLQFQTRPNIADAFVPGRDIGLVVHLHSTDERYRFWSGIFTGNGSNTKKDDSKGKPLVATRIDFQPLGAVGEEESDIEQTTPPKLLIGANVAHSEDTDSASKDPEYLRTIPGTKLLYGADATLKYRGVFVTGEIHQASFQPDSGRNFTAGGFLAQAGYYIASLRLEPCVRYDVFDQCNHVGNDRERTITYGLNFLPRGQSVKLMLNYYQHLKRTSGDRHGWNADEIRLLWQILF